MNIKVNQLFFLILVILTQPGYSGREFHLESMYLPGHSTPESPDAPVRESLREKIELTGEWQAQILNATETTRLTVPGLFSFPGSVVFTRSFFLANNLSTRHFKFVAEGINYRSSVFINERFVGTHFGGFTRFAYDLEPEFFHFGGQNEIRILVDNWLDSRQTIPAKYRPLAEKNLGGIHRAVYLQVLPKHNLDDFTFQLSPADAAGIVRLALQVSLRNLDRRRMTGITPVENQFQVTAKLTESTSQKMIAENQVEYISQSQILENCRIELELDRPHLWSPESPFLYQIELTLAAGKQIIDSLQQVIGLRTISIVGNRILCNGEACFLKGVEWRNDWTPANVAQRSAYLARVVAAIKNLGANAVRPVGLPPDPEFINLCNQSGVFVFEELPIQFLPKERFRKSAWLELAEIQFSEMVLRDRNQPSVIAWGIGTGLDGHQPDITDYCQRISNLIRKLDSRPVYQVHSAFFFNPGKKLTDFCFAEITDLTRSDLDAILAAGEFSLMEEPVIYSIGYPFHQSEMDPVSFTQKESRQSYFLGLAARKIKTTTPATGLFINSLFDWNLAQPTSLFGKESPPDCAPFGLIAATGQKRLAFHHLAAFFSEDKTTPLTAISRPDDSTHFFTVSGILILLAFIYLVKRNRRISGDLRRVLQRPHGFITDIRENRKIPFPETIGLGLVVLFLLALVSAEFVFYLKNNFYFDQIINLFLNSTTKARLLQLVWYPHYLLLAFLLGYFLAFFSGAIVVTLFAKLFGKKTSFNKAITFIFWMNSLVLIFLPAGPILFNLLSLQGSQPIFTGVFGLVLLVVVLRSIHGLAVLYFEKKRYIYLAVFLMLVILGVSSGIYFQKNNALFDYLAFYLTPGH